ncbi:MAG: ABC transporter ATP-binding protein [Candidatus Hydrogenedentota bacterium]
MPESTTVKRAVFRVRDVTKEYVMGEVTVKALRGITLDVQEREFLCILGPSGSGKSTLLNIVGGLDAPTAGEVYFRDEMLTNYSDAQRTQYRRVNIGFVFQFYNLMPNLTALENVSLATEISPHPMPPADALDMVNLGPRKDHFPSQLSGGEQQRVAIARAVAKRPEILLCDEPTGALDFNTGKVVLDALNAINERLDTTVIIITHNAAIGGMADRVVRMIDGHVKDIEENAQRLRADQLEW